MKWSSLRTDLCMQPTQEELPIVQFCSLGAMQEEELFGMAGEGVDGVAMWNRLGKPLLVRRCTSGHGSQRLDPQMWSGVTQAAQNVSRISRLIVRLHP